MQIPKESRSDATSRLQMFRIQYNIQIIALVRRMLVNVNRDGEVVSIDFINGVPDECFGRRCSNVHNSSRKIAYYQYLLLNVV
jgi:hypothetical protein